MPTYFTADTHFGHANIIRHAKRPFASVEEMDEALIRNWNAIVQPGDTVYHLGDFAWKPRAVASYVCRLNGHIHLILGNHDRKSQLASKLFDSVAEYCEVKMDGQRITLCHYAMRVWNKGHYGAWNLYGHSHGNLPEDPHSYSTDVGVDCWAYAPVSFARLQSHMSLKQFKPVDHHGHISHDQAPELRDDQ
jgi:calcineurin-like phosphoesterase family protein